jgi:hypothetical protein
MVATPYERPVNFRLRIRSGRVGRLSGFRLRFSGPWLAVMWML